MIGSAMDECANMRSFKTCPSKAERKFALGPPPDNVVPCPALPDEVAGLPDGLGPVGHPAHGEEARVPALAVHLAQGRGAGHGQALGPVERLLTHSILQGRN